MGLRYQVRLFHNGKLLFTGVLEKLLEIGRQNPDVKEEAPSAENRYAVALHSGDRAAVPRLLIAQKGETDISRRHVQVEPLPGGRVRLKNVSHNQPVRFPDRPELPTNSAAIDLPVPLTFSLGTRTIEVRDEEENEPGLQSLSGSTRLAGGPIDLPSIQYSMTLAGAGLGFEEMLSWLQAAMDVLQSAAHSTAFFQKAAQAAVNLVGLTSSQVLLLEGGAWKAVAWHHATQPPGKAPAYEPSKRVLARVRDERKTFWQTRRRPENLEDSLHNVQAVVASPILDRQGGVIGALYGDRHIDHQKPGIPSLNKLEALLLELLATGVAAGLSRVEQERAALAARVQFEQFFTPELAAHLAAHPEMLEGSDAEVTVLFCDIRRFSHFSELIGPAQTVEWIRNVMETLSECVLAQRGVLVDYIGDELMAMWGAPAKQPDHAVLACRAAVAMCEQLTKLNERWGPVLGEPMEIGIGLNSGTARVGNTGTHRKFKYGPLGNTVNLASRVQDATKLLKVRLLLTSGTKLAAGDMTGARRVGKVRVRNITATVELYELRCGDEPGWADLKAGYEKALAEFERRDFGLAARGLGNLLIDHAGDGPSLVLLSRAVNALVHEPEQFDAVWELPAK